MPTSIVTCINGRPLLSSRATASRLNSGENSLLISGIQHLHALTGLAEVSTESRDHYKSEMVWRTSFQTRAAAELALGRYIDGFYNPRRRHSALGYKSPVSFEAMMAITE
jgi:transposase InsO family protein